MTDLINAILSYLEKNGSIDTLQLSALLTEDHQKVIGAVKSIQAAGNVINAEPQLNKSWALTEEGIEVAQKGSHEALVYHAVPPEGILQSELMKTVPTAKIGFSKAMSSGWIWMDKKGNKPLVKRKVTVIEDDVQQILQKIQQKCDDTSEVQKQDLKKRKLLQEVNVKSFVLSKGSEFNTTLVKLETDLTDDMLSRHMWKQLQFKPYNFNALGVAPTCGHLHPLMKVRTAFRQIFLEMGFTEMPTNNFIESSFWNFDALFQPQQHPARDAHDTFFVSNPQLARDFPLDYLEKVKAVHEHGGYGSQGYNYNWKLEEARKNLLRTHTTAVSARMLYSLAQEKEFRPVKYFSIDRVFRNETLDATHLAEFHQIEGVIADFNLTLGHLIGVLHEFFKKLGITKLRFKPAYNPYTEPSMEIFSYHEGLKKWVEVGNSGVFRPEMLLPMGLPPNVQVVAWGLSLERPTMIKYGLNNIRDLVGHKLNLQMVQENPLCRLDKNSLLNEAEMELQEHLSSLEKHQKDILIKLRCIWNEVQNLQLSSSANIKIPPTRPKGVKWEPKEHCLIRNNVEKNVSMHHEQNVDTAVAKDAAEHVVDAPMEQLTIYSSPRRPVWSLLVMHHLLCQQFVVEASATVDTNLPAVDVRLKNFFHYSSSRDPATKCNPAVKLHLVWREVGDETILTVGGKSILGEVNIVRYLGRCMSLDFESDPILATLVDDWLDKIHTTILHGHSKAREALLKQLNGHLEKSAWLVGNVYTLADLAMWSALNQMQAVDTAQVNIGRWMDACAALPWITTAAELIKSYY